MKHLQAAIFDVDGTLFDYRHKKIHDSTVEAVRALKARGVTVIVASGRSYPLLGEECLTKVAADYYVTANGHTIQDRDGKVLYARRFTLDQTEQVVALTRQYGNGLLLKYADHSCLYSRSEEMFQVFNNIGLQRSAFRDCPAMDYHYRELPVGFTIRGSDEIKRLLSARTEDFRLELFFDVTECDVFSPDTNKMTGLRRLAEMLSLDPQCCMAFGDGRNDIEMLQWVGKGIAMGNACDDLKAAADEVCACSWEDGIAKALRPFLCP